MHIEFSCLYYNLSSIIDLFNLNSRLLLLLKITMECFESTIKRYQKVEGKDNYMLCFLQKDFVPIVPVKPLDLCFSPSKVPSIRCQILWSLYKKVSKMKSDSQLCNTTAKSCFESYLIFWSFNFHIYIRANSKGFIEV